MTPIFPILDIKTFKDSNGIDLLKGKKERFHVSVITNVRKFYKEKWYLCQVIENGFISFPDEERELMFINECVGRCNMAAYKILLFGIVVPEMKGLTGNDIFEIHSDQRSEDERLNIFLKENL